MKNCLIVALSGFICMSDPENSISNPQDSNSYLAMLDTKAPQRLLIKNERHLKDRLFIFWNSFPKEDPYHGLSKEMPCHCEKLVLYVHKEQRIFGFSIVKLLNY